MSVSALDGIVNWTYADEFMIFRAPDKPTRYFHKCFGSPRLEEEIAWYFAHTRVILLDVASPRTLNADNIAKAFKNDMVKECTCNLKNRVSDLTAFPHVFNCEL